MAGISTKNGKKRKKKTSDFHGILGPYLSEAGDLYMHVISQMNNISNFLK